MVTESKSFIVSFWSRVFEILEKISLFTLVRRFLKKAVTERFADGWVMGHLAGAIAALFGAAVCGQS